MAVRDRRCLARVTAVQPCTDANVCSPGLFGVERIIKKCPYSITRNRSIFYDSKASIPLHQPFPTDSMDPGPIYPTRLGLRLTTTKFVSQTTKSNLPANPQNRSRHRSCRHFSTASSSTASELPTRSRSQLFCRKRCAETRSPSRCRWTRGRRSGQPLGNCDLRCDYCSIATSSNRLQFIRAVDEADSHSAWHRSRSFPPPQASCQLVQGRN